MDTYLNPLVERYGSEEMLYIFSPKMKFSTWRKLWIALAETQQELGISISDEQICEMKSKVEDIDIRRADEYEKEFRHDVMAHVHAFGEAAPKAKPIIHLGATSAFVGDNTDIIQHKEALKLIKKKLINVMKTLGDFADKYKELPTLGFTHYQPAQLTTVGKRATLWLHSLLMDWEELEFVFDSLKIRGVKGTTGTGASYSDLFEGDYRKFVALDKKVAEKMGFNESQAVTGQTYDRKVDSRVLNLLSGIAQSAHKFTNDLRLLSNLKEIEEPFAKNQIGSSAMAYKRNPMRSERISSLAKFVMSLANNPAQVASNQWFERTLDDSANKRLSIPQAFLATDALLSIWHNVADGLVVYAKVIEKHVKEELPFMMTEMLIMEGVKAGGDRQVLHESIRIHSIEAGKRVKQEGKENDLLERIAKDKNYPFTLDQLKEIAKPKKYIGFAIEQTTDFLNTHLNPILSANEELIGMNYELKV